MNTFIETADAKQTDREIMEAIWEASGKNETEAQRVWDDPKPEEFTAIWEIVTGNGLRASTDYCWGAAGSNWMPK